MEYSLAKCLRVKWIGNWILTWTVPDTLKKEHGLLTIIFQVGRAKMLIEGLQELVIYQTRMKERECWLYWSRLLRDDTLSSWVIQSQQDKRIVWFGVEFITKPVQMAALSVTQIPHI